MISFFSINLVLSIQISYLTSNQQTPPPFLFPSPIKWLRALFRCAWEFYPTLMRSQNVQDWMLASNTPNHDSFPIFFHKIRDYAHY